MKIRNRHLVDIYSSDLRPQTSEDIHSFSATDLFRMAQRMQLQKERTMPPRRTMPWKQHFISSDCHKQRND